ncbi:MAG: P-II family nitrogen regulator [Scytolyngbya sp. HA4215-MV1]|jgi:nitrogen regulatory protein PII|nr:P-II family nitrogen regulator [Scytolyngbya sp. HA4215-MV1]
MHPVKRIEIISDSIELGKIVESLEKAQVSSYTVIRNVGGKGIKGTMSNDLDMSRMENDYVLAICPPEQVKSVVESVRPILNRFGGICLISDAMEIRSMQCVASL